MKPIYSPPAATSTPPSLASKPAKRHLGILDLLRGFAALSVVLYHFTGGALPKLQTAALEHLFSWGYMGVEVFFVISGFVIPYSLWQTGYSPQRILPYLRKRVLRICPPAYVSLLLLMLQWVIIDYFIHHSHARLDTLSWRQVVDNLTFTAPFTNRPWMNAVFWTLAIEFQFYLVVGLLYNSLYRSSIPVFLALSLLLDGMQYLPGLPTDNFFRFSLFFALGGAALLYYQGSLSIHYFLLISVFFTCLLAYHLSLWPALFGLATTLLIVFVRVQHPLFRWLGTISYSLYLTHFVAGATAEFILVKLLHPQASAMIMLTIAGCVLTALAVAYGFYRLVEQPFHKLARRLPQ